METNKVSVRVAGPASDAGGRVAVDRETFAALDQAIVSGGQLHEHHLRTSSRRKFRSLAPGAIQASGRRSASHSQMNHE